MEGKKVPLKKPLAILEKRGSGGGGGGGPDRMDDDGAGPSGRGCEGTDGGGIGGEDGPQEEQGTPCSYEVGADTWRTPFLRAPACRRHRLGAKPPP
jgi:hypothetical protein